MNQNDSTLPADDIMLWCSVLQEQAAISQKNLHQMHSARTFLTTFMSTRTGNKHLLYPNELHQEAYLYIVRIVVKYLQRLADRVQCHDESTLHIVTMLALSVTILEKEVFDSPIYPYKLWGYLGIAVQKLEKAYLNKNSNLEKETEKVKSILELFCYHPDAFDIGNIGIEIKSV
jgi:hypothetical protein